jgi:3-hydroxyisobutyrate dehydrogenase
METIGFTGVGTMGMPITQNLIKSGYRVVGFRRSSLDAFEKAGGVSARSAADVGAQADIVLSCLPSTEALDDAMQGPNGLIRTARRTDRGGAWLTSGAGQEASDCAAEGKGRDLCRW